MTTVTTDSLHGVLCCIYSAYIYIYILTGEVCGGTVREVNAETERAASPGTAKHQVAPL